MPNRFTIPRKSLQQVEIPAVRTYLHDDGTLFLDFGKAVFGSLVIQSGDKPLPTRLVVHLGEQSLKCNNEPGFRLNREPLGSIRYLRTEESIDPQAERVRLNIPPDERNTRPGSIRMPADVGEVFPFRYAEIENVESLDAWDVRQLAVWYPFDDNAASFESSDETLDAIWSLCKHSIKATSFCGVYVDGDRERVPYEGDAYLNQLCHYGVDCEYSLARYTHEYLIQNPTWPTEWQIHSVMMAWADYLYTGNVDSLTEFYDELCAKTLIDLARDDGLISTKTDLCTREFEKRLNLFGDDYIFKRGLTDLVDWPPGSFTVDGTGERDGHEMCAFNTVINAFHCHALGLMSRIAAVVGRADDERKFDLRAHKVAATINTLLFDTDRGVYIDGEGSCHASLHSNMFMLAFNLVPESRKHAVIDYVESRGMACSVYGAQYLLEALYLNGRAQQALHLMTSKTDRGWWNMIRCGSTITWEAWDLKYKNNLDWNHAWGAVPANIIPRFLLGVRPLKPGFSEVLVQPQPGDLQHMAGVVPTVRGPVWLSFRRDINGVCHIDLTIPVGVKAVVKLSNCCCDTVRHNGDVASARLEHEHVILDLIDGGEHNLTYLSEHDTLPVAIGY